MKFKGRVFKFGDNIDTDVIIPARYLVYTDPTLLATHCMEPIDPDFAKKVKRGDIIVAGSNFGCGSSREHAPIAILGLGVPLVIAKSFARIFYRNAFNKGLLLLESDLYEYVKEGDEIAVDVKEGLIVTKDREFRTKPIPPFMIELIESGGLLNYLKKRLGIEGG
ncbi:MAG: 3-isopropylmalate dehydratase small subunit [Desulfobacterota bacterium]|nr:3-isopropylmalate dehydratase small subunit [Thermodesulfobacteriota bacterium]MDW8001463.1 3-isopropylmalate dehydratase small subunit [Deltaproteobacteria bacterium]